MGKGPLLALEISLGSVLRAGGVALIAVALWAILVLVSSFFLKRKGPARGLLNQLRFVFFPALILYVLALVYGPEERGTLHKVAATALAAAGVLLGMGLLNIFLGPAVLRRWLGREVPDLLVDVGRYLIVIVAVAVILQTIWGASVTPLLGALGIGGIVLGLALQETLSNFFSGLAILAERPFSIGDWIQIGEGRAGQVERVTWRAIKLRTLDNEYIIYPNSMVAKDKVVNYSLPTRVQALRVAVGTSYHDSPGVLADPAPSIFTHTYADFAINYEIKFFIEDFGARGAIQDAVMTRLWYAFRRGGIEIPFPIREIRLQGGLPGLAGPPPGPAAEPPPPGPDAVDALGSAPIFAELTPEEGKTLARGARRLEFGYGERVIRQADPGDALYLITRGRARVAVKGEDGAERDVAVLKGGDVFGEMSLLTGEPRTASVHGHGELEVIEVGKAALAPVLAANPALAARIAEVVVLRREGLDSARLEGEEARRAEVAAATGTLVGRIRAFFGLKR